MEHLMSSARHEVRGRAVILHPPGSAGKNADKAVRQEGTVIPLICL